MENTIEKKWGLYTTIKNPKILDTLDELDIWTKINSLYGTLANHQHYYNSESSDILNKKRIEDQYNLEYLIYYTRRFGVEFDSIPSSTEHIKNSDMFTAWYNYWKEFITTLSEDVYNKILDEKLAGNDISKYLPLDNWKTVYEKKINRRLR